MLRQMANDVISYEHNLRSFPRPPTVVDRSSSEACGIRCGLFRPGPGAVTEKRHYASKAKLSGLSESYLALKADLTKDARDRGVAFPEPGFPRTTHCPSSNHHCACINDALIIEPCRFPPCRGSPDINTACVQLKRSAMQLNC